MEVSAGKAGASIPLILYAQLIAPDPWGPNGVTTSRGMEILHALQGGHRRNTLKDRHEKHSTTSAMVVTRKDVVKRGDALLCEGAEKRALRA
jgi:hypothetical protein